MSEIELELGEVISDTVAAPASALYLSDEMEPGGQEITVTAESER